MPIRTISWSVGDTEYPGAKLWRLDAPGELSLHCEALNSPVLPVRHTELLPVLCQSQAVRDVEAVVSPGESEGPGPLAPLQQLLHLMLPARPHSDPVLDDATVAVSVTHKEAVGVLRDGHCGGFAVVMVVTAGDKSLSQHYQWLVIPTVWSELEHLMESNVCHPDVVLAVHCDHVWQEEHILAPRVDDVARGVDSKHGVQWDGDVPVQTVAVVPDMEGSLV